MKKLISLLALLATTMVIHAQNWTLQSFLDAKVASIQITNTIGLTNMTGTSITSNLVGVIYTNNNGTKVTLAGGDTTTLFNDVTLWVNRNGDASPLTIIPQQTNSYFSINVLAVGNQAGAASTNTISLRFACVPDGSNTSTDGKDTFAMSVPYNGTTVVYTRTNIASGSFIGVKALRLIDIYEDAVNGKSGTIKQISLTGFVP